MLDFAVTGLARSRTAWFAAFLTDGVSHCWHDWSVNVIEPSDYLKARVDGKQSGISDTGFWLLGQKAPEYAARILVVHRDPWSVRKSVRRAFNVNADMTQAAKRLHDVPGKHVDFAALTSHDVLSECFEYLTGRPADMNRIRLFADLNIQTAIGDQIIGAITPRHFIARG